MSLQDQPPAGPPLLILASAKPLGRRHLALAAAGLALLYLAGVTGQWWPGNDSAVYLGLARSLAGGEGYRFNGQVSTAFAPGLPILLAGLYRLAGEGMWLPNLFMAACGLTALLLTYLSLRRLGLDRRPALAVTCATGLAYSFYFNAHRVLSDMPFAAVFWLLLHCVLRAREGRWRWIVLAGALSAAAAALRAPAVVLLGPLGLGVLLDSSLGKRWPRRLAASAAIALPAAATVGALLFLATRLSTHTPNYVKLSIPASGAAAYLHRLQHGLTDLPAGLAETITSQSIPAVGLVLLALAAAGGVRFWNARRRMVPITLAGYLLLLAVCLSREGMRGRYLAPVLPLLVLLAGEGLCWCVVLLGRWWRALAGAKTAPAALAAFAGIIMLVNLPRTARQAFYYSYRSHGSDYYSVIREGNWAELAEAAKLLGRECPPGALAAAPTGDVDVLHFLSRRQVVPLPGAAAGTVDFILVRTDVHVAPAPAETADLPDLKEFKPIYQGHIYLLWRRI